MVWAVLAVHIAFSQEDQVKKFVDGKKKFESDTFGWKKGAFFNVNFNNAQFENWAAGGQNSLSISGIADFFAIHRKNRHIWESYLLLGYGVLRNDNDPMRKNEDIVNFFTKYGYRLSQYWNYSSLLSLETQMFPGYTEGNPEGNFISNFLAPATGIFSTGMDFKVKNVFSAYISPVTGKFTIVADRRLANQGQYGLQVADTVNGVVQNSDQIRMEFGSYLKLMFQKDIMKNTNLKSRMDLFSNYNNPAAIDVNWETTLTMKVNKILSASVFTHLKYDEDYDTQPDDQHPGKQINTQFKYVLGVGLAYRIGDQLK